MKRLSYFLAVLCTTGLVLLIGWPSLTYAQGGEGDSRPPGGTTVHVVQRDETLFRIAMQYGTTVEAIAEANGISDPRLITVGQRLLIPNAQAAAPGALTAYAVQPGDSLTTLARVFNTTAESLAAANHLTNPERLYIGQPLIISQAAHEAALPPVKALHRARPGDNLYRLALTYQVPFNQLLSINQITPPTPLFAGQAVWIPGSEPPAALTDLPYPFVACRVSPVPATQGQTVSVYLQTAYPVALSGSFMSYTVQFAAPTPTEFYALFGIHAFVTGGVFPLTVTAVAPDGTQAALVLRLRVEEGGYGAESISLATEQQDLLAPAVNEPEWQQVATLMSGFTPQRYFDGMMGLPSTGPITSEFGTRRTYNGGVLNTFHSGTDFGAGPGSPILAPAGGVVVLAQALPVRGNATIIDHGWGVYTGYWHQAEMYVSAGSVVTPGQTIGTVGSTGRVTGPHLHWEMWVGGVQVDPMQWVQQSFPE